MSAPASEAARAIEAILMVAEDPVEAFVSARNTLVH